MIWVIPKLEKFPRSQKFVLGDRIENLMLDILELLLNAAYSKNKYKALKSASLKLEMLRYLIRLSKDLKLMNLKAYEFSARSIEGIGVSIGGWLKYSRHENI